MAIPSSSKNFERVATRSAGRLPRIRFAVLAASGPDPLTMPMPPLPGGVAIAAIVSFLYMSRDDSFSRFDLSCNVPLLQ